MGLLVAIVSAVVASLLLAGKLLSILGFIATCASFSFPLGLIGMVGIGVSLVFLLGPRTYTD